MGFGRLSVGTLKASQQITAQVSAPKTEAKSNATLKMTTVSKIQPGMDQAS